MDVMQLLMAFRYSLCFTWLCAARGDAREKRSVSAGQARRHPASTHTSFFRGGAVWRREEKRGQQKRQVRRSTMRRNLREEDEEMVRGKSILTG